MKDAIMAVVNDRLVLAVLVLTALDFLVAVMAAVKAGTFQWRRLSDVMREHGPAVVVYCAVRLASLLYADLVPVAAILAGIMVVSDLASIGTNLRTVFGVPVPLPAPPHG